MLHPGIVGMRESMLIRLRRGMRSSTPLYAPPRAQYGRKPILVEALNSVARR